MEHIDHDYLSSYQENLNISFVIKGGFNFEIVRLR